MKDTIITARQKKIELITLLMCFVVANLCNLYAIIEYGTPFSELITSIFYVLIFTVVLYVVWTAVRLLFYRIKSIFIQNK
ncbi:MAG: hypothetical protein LBN06_10505 [Prevotellaceae bacterium]|jgi:hypothetical protein|nr:hypothetical protein [Prevotellaceae bacterium]